MRLSDIIIYLSFLDKPKPFILSSIPGISRETSISFLFKSCNGEKALRCCGPLTIDECVYLSGHRSPGAILYNDLLYDLNKCSLCDFQDLGPYPPSIASLSRIPPRSYNSYMEFSLITSGTLSRINHLDFGLRRQ